MHNGYYHGSHQEQCTSCLLLGALIAVIRLLMLVLSFSAGPECYDNLSLYVSSYIVMYILGSLGPSLTAQHAMTLCP